MIGSTHYVSQDTNIVTLQKFIDKSIFREVTLYTYIWQNFNDSTNMTIADIIGPFGDDSSY